MHTITSKLSEKLSVVWTKSLASPSPRAPLRLNEQRCIHVPPFRLHFLMVSNTLFETQEVQPIGLLFITSTQQQDQDRGHRICPATKSASWSSKWGVWAERGGWESIHYLNSALALLWEDHCLNGSDQPTITDHNAFSAWSTSLEVCLRSPVPLHMSKAAVSTHHGYGWYKTATRSADIKQFRQILSQCIHHCHMVSVKLVSKTVWLNATILKFLYLCWQYFCMNMTCCM